MVETRRLKELRRRSGDLLRLPSGDLVVALSGGADSGTLAYLIRQLGRDLRAVHVHHGLPASDRLEEAARAIAAAVGVGLEVVRIEIPLGASIEGQARNVRYSALLAELRPGETLLTAHTVDDQVPGRKPKEIARSPCQLLQATRLNHRSGLSISSSVGRLPAPLKAKPTASHPDSRSTTSMNRSPIWY